MKDFDNILWEANIGKYLSGNYSSTEESALMDWMDSDPGNRRRFEEMKQVWDLSADQALTLTPAEIKNDWLKVQSSILTQPPVIEDKPKQAGIIPMFIRLAASAAVILILIFAGRQLLQNQHDQAAWTKFASEAESRYIRLPDGSQVWLNKSSSIEYHKEFDKREVVLDGEAFFEVTKEPNRPFTVLAEGSKTTVLGTRFNLNTNAENNEIALVVEEGRVAFEVISNPNSTTIVKGEESAIASVEEAFVVKQLKADPNIYSWKTQQLVFDDAQLSDVVMAIERHFGVDLEIVNADMQHCVVRTLLRDASLDSALETIKFILDCEITESEGIYYLDGSPCINTLQ